MLSFPKTSCPFLPIFCYLCYFSILCCLLLLFLSFAVFLSFSVFSIFFIFFYFPTFTTSFAPFICCFSSSAFVNSILPQYGSCCSPETFQIHFELDMVHIISIQFSFLPDRQLIPSMDLCPSGKTRTDAVCAVLLTLHKEVILIPECRTRANQRISPFRILK